MINSRFFTDGVDIKYFKPNHKGKYNDLAVVFFGGSEGGFPKLYDFSYYTKLGIACISLAYFKTKYTQKTLDKIDLCKLKNSINQCRKQFDIEKKKLLAFGYSKGAELALVLSSFYSDIKGAVVLNPSNVVFQSPDSLINNKSASSWVNQDGEIPYVELDYNRFIKSKRKAYRELYRKAIEFSEDEKAIIQVEKINGPILMISGNDDIVWPSTMMSAMIMKRLSKENFRHWKMNITYGNAGHTLNPFYRLGGTYKGNKDAKKDMRKRVRCFLNEVLKS